MSASGEIEPLVAGSPARPSPFGRFYLLGLVARGGMAEIYRAREAEPDGAPRLLAIKVMRPKLSREPRFVEMFEREGRLATILKSRAIVETIEHGRVGGRPYIAMAFIPGRDLGQLLRRCQEQGQRIPVPHAVHIAARIAEGLDFAHNLRDDDGRPLNLVNRDVSPSNVRVSFDGEVKLIDFGIAQALMGFSSEIGILKGKFSYMSPEQIRGLPLDARTDIFSCGIVLHEMLTTEKLFRGDSEFALMEKVRNTAIAPPSRRNRRVSPELDRITLRALARDPDDRYASAAELREDLERVLEAYKFDASELRDFSRRLFRKEWLEEEAEEEVALRSQPDAGRTPSASDAEDEPTPRATMAAPQVERTTDTGAHDRRSGFWSRFRRRGNR